MDKSKIIAVAVLIGIGGALFYSKSQDPAAPGADEAAPQPTAIAGVAPDESANAINNAATAEVSATAAPDADGNSTATDNAATATETQPEPDTTELKIIDQRAGKGPEAKTGDSLSMNYKGTLLNGKVFDQSYGRGPFEFQLGAGNVIQGWDKGIVGMKVGGKRKLVIPADLAYGAQSPSPDIPANSTLVFEVELLSVNGKSS